MARTPTCQGRTAHKKSACMRFIFEIKLVLAMFDLLFLLFCLSGCHENMRALPFLNTVVGAISPELAIEAAEIIGFSNSSSTKSSYSVGQKSYLRFVAMYGISPFPLNDNILILWATSISSTRKHSTVRSYISSVRSLAQSLGFDCGDKLSFRLRALLRGLKRLGGPISASTRLPITRDILLSLKNHIPVSFVGSMTYAAMVFTYGGVFRSGEVFYKSDGKSGLQLGDVLFKASGRSRIYLNVSLKFSKTDTFGAGVSVKIYASNNGICAVEAMKNYLALRKSCHLAWDMTAPLFVWPNGVAVSRTEFVIFVKYFLSKANFDHSKFAGHSFRRGAATDLYNDGVSQLKIMAAGRLKSNAFLRYIEK